MIRRPPRSTQSRSSAASDVYKRQHKDYFTASKQTSTIAGVRSTLSEDVYVLLAGWEGDNATFKVYVNPLVNWVWLGGILLTLGTLFAAWPAGSTQRRWSMVLSPAPSAAVEG